MVALLMLAGSAAAVVARPTKPLADEIGIPHLEVRLPKQFGEWRVDTIMPTILPALLTGFSLSFARALGEYGSVVFIAGNLPMKTEITPLLIIMKLEEYDYTGATAIACVMLIASFFMLFVVNVLQWWASRRQRGGK